MFHAIFLAYMPTGEALKPERDPPGVLTGRTGKKEAPWVGLPRLPSFPPLDYYGTGNVPLYAHFQLGSVSQAAPRM